MYYTKLEPFIRSYKYTTYLSVYAINVLIIYKARVALYICTILLVSYVSEAPKKIDSVIFNETSKTISTIHN